MTEALSNTNTQQRSRKPALPLALAIVGFLAVLATLLPAGARATTVVLATATVVFLIAQKAAPTFAWTMGALMCALFASASEQSYAFVVAAPIVGGAVAGMLLPSRRRWKATLTSAAGVAAGAYVGVLGLEYIGGIAGFAFGGTGGLFGAALSGALGGAVAGWIITASNRHDLDTRLI